ncbi:MAG: rRNA pseudouridine synthase [Chloroflexi bacterium]|nr:rRNA pseudouridine synthase [Chloroflexota bacterium]
MRLNKFLAHAGVSSRRGADVLIQEGRVQVNGKTVYTMGIQVDPDKDVVTCDGKPVHVRTAAPTTILLNKPAGYLSTRNDPQGRPTVFQLVPPEFHSLYPVGRLDLDSEGLILLTNDGDLTYRLTHASFHHEKEYWVQIKGWAPEPALRKLRKGVEIEDGIARAKIGRLERIPLEQRFWLEPKPTPNTSWLIFTLEEGRKRQIRYMCQAIDLEIKRLVRVRIASLHIGDMRPGEWRRPTKRQQRAIAAIKGMKGEKP